MLTSLVNNISQPGLFLDLGSHSGFFSIYVQKNAQKIEHTHAFDVDTFSKNVISKNIAINQLQDHITFYNDAVSGTQELYGITYNAKNRGSTFISTTSDTQNDASTISEKPTISISHWHSRLQGNKKIAAIKLDVEGQEYAILWDIFQNIENRYWPDVIVTELNPRFGNCHSIEKLILNSGFHLVASENENCSFVRSN